MSSLCLDQNKEFCFPLCPPLGLLDFKYFWAVVRSGLTAAQLFKSGVFGLFLVCFRGSQKNREIFFGRWCFALKHVWAICNQLPWYLPSESKCSSSCRLLVVLESFRIVLQPVLMRTRGRPASWRNRWVKDDFWLEAVQGLLTAMAL